MPQLSRIVRAMFLAGLFMALHGSPVQADDDFWVRTRDGWERSDAWQPRQPVYEPSLHPAVVASLVVLTSVFGLVSAATAPSKTSEHHGTYVHPASLRLTPRAKKFAAECTELAGQGH